MTGVRILFCLVVTCVICGCGQQTEPQNLHSDPEPEVITPWLKEITDQANVNFVHQTGNFNNFEMPSIMGSGLSLIDYDLNGELDIYLVNGRPTDLQLPSDVNRGDVLYQAQGTAKFQDVSKHIGIETVEFGMGAWWGDYDQDGFHDLFLTSVGRNRLFRNMGDGTFDLVTLPDGVAEQAWSTAACWSDINSDGLPDLFVVNYVDYVPGQYCDGDNGQEEFCGPSAYTGTVDRVLINTGDAGAPFIDETVSSGIGNKAGKGLAVVAEDFNQDGLVDLYVSNDMESNDLWIQKPEGQFEEQAVFLGVARNFLGETEASMGTITNDWNIDGIPDLFLCHLTGETNTLYLSDADSGTWRDETAKSGLGPSSLRDTAFGVLANDLELDGDLDILIVSGAVKRDSAILEFNEIQQPYAQQNALFINTGEQYHFEKSDVHAGEFSSQKNVSRGLAMGDLDGDGDNDFVVSNCSGPAQVFLNTAPRLGASLNIRLIDPLGCRDAVGAKITLTTHEGKSYYRTVNPYMGYLSQSHLAVHFGIPSELTVESVEIHWPDGERDRFQNEIEGHSVVLVRGQGFFSLPAVEN